MPDTSINASSIELPSAGLNNLIRSQIEYSKALQITRKNYYAQLGKFQNTEQENQIWEARFTLQYMLNTLARHIQLLKLLQQDKKHIRLLNQLLEVLPQLTRESSIRDYLQTFQEWAKKEEITAALKTLRSKDLNRSERNLVLGCGCIGLAIALPMCALLPLGLASIPYIAVSAILLSIIGICFLAFADQNPNLIHPINTEGVAFFSNDTYDESTKHETRAKEVHLKRFLKDTPSNIRNNFFNKTYTDKKLVEEVNDALCSVH